MTKRIKSGFFRDDPNELTSVELEVFRNLYSKKIEMIKDCLEIEIYKGTEFRVTHNDAVYNSMRMAVKKNRGLLYDDNLFEDKLLEIAVQTSEMTDP